MYTVAANPNTEDTMLEPKCTTEVCPSLISGCTEPFGTKVRRCGLYCVGSTPESTTFLSEEGVARRMKHHLERAKHVYRTRGVEELARSALSSLPLEINTSFFASVTAPGRR